MCSRYESPEQAQLARALHINVDLPEYKSIAYPGYDEPIVRDSGEGLIAELRFWGNIYPRPSKKDPNKLTYPNYQNAKGETLDRIYKAEWSNNQRCLIPIRRFWEPLRGKMTAIESEEEIITLAGFWGKTITKNGERESFNMITVPANQFMTQFHGVNDEKRMPGIILAKDRAEYASIDTPPDQAIKLCRPFVGNLLVSSS